MALQLLARGDLDAAAQAIESARGMLAAPFASATDADRARVESAALRVAVARGDGGRAVGAANALHSAYPGTLPAAEIEELRTLVEEAQLRDELRSAIGRVIQGITPAGAVPQGWDRVDTSVEELAPDGLPVVDPAGADGHLDLPFLEDPAREEEELPYVVLDEREPGDAAARSPGGELRGGVAAVAAVAAVAPEARGEQPGRGGAGKVAEAERGEATAGAAPAAPPLPESDSRGGEGMWRDPSGGDEEVPEVPGEMFVARGEVLEDVIERFLAQHVAAAVEDGRGAAESGWSFFLIGQYAAAVELFGEALRDPEVRLSAAEGAVRSYLAMGQGQRAVEFVARLGRTWYSAGLPELLRYWGGRAAETVGDGAAARAAYLSVDRTSYPDVAPRLQSLPR
ncbi:MAG TPA: hypothetical protein VF263_02160 [Longimicrobiaceae bacterium]